MSAPVARSDFQADQVDAVGTIDQAVIKEIIGFKLGKAGRIVDFRRRRVSFEEIEHLFVTIVSDDGNGIIAVQSTPSHGLKAVRKLRHEG